MRVRPRSTSEWWLSGRDCRGFRVAVERWAGLLVPGQFHQAKPARHQRTNTMKPRFQQPQGGGRRSRNKRIDSKVTRTDGKATRTRAVQGGVANVESKKKRMAIPSTPIERT